MLMLLCVHVTSVLFLVLAGNSALLRFYVVTRSYSSCPFLCALGVYYKQLYSVSFKHVCVYYLHSCSGLQYYSERTFLPL